MSNARLSIIQARAVRDSNVSHAQLRVLCALGMYSDEEGWCFPKQKTLATDLNISRQMINQHIQALKKAGYIEIYHKYNSEGGQIRNTYRLVFDLEEQEKIVNREDEEFAGGVKSDLTGGDNADLTALTSHINVPLKHMEISENSENSDDMDIYEWLETKKKKQLESKPFDKNEYSERIEKATLTGMINASVLDLSQWPEDVRPVVSDVCRLWKVRPPTGRRRGGPSGYWITSARDLIDACAEFNPTTILDEIWSDFQNHALENDGEYPFCVEGPGSLVKACRAKAGKLRLMPTKDKMKVNKDGSLYI